jgi:predicted transcriptional regulator
MAEDDQLELLTLTAEIVAAHVGHNRVGVAELPELIARVHGALAGLGEEPAPVAPAEQKPAVSIRASIKPDYLVCLEDGRKLTMLKRYLQTNYGMTPQQYRAKWKLPADYPMVSPNYADKRRTLAKAIGLGRKRGDQAPASKRGRRKA